ncbi:MAG: ABC transporter ATP-binding protein [Solirubrobacteraceae bacterium]
MNSLVHKRRDGQARVAGPAFARRRPHAHADEGVLRAVGVTRSFDGVQALTEVDMELARAEILGLIGPNGAGKTTLVNVVTGFDFPTRGRVELEGRNITRWKTHMRGRAGLARTFQATHAFRGLSVRENIEVAALGVGVSARVARQRATNLIGELGLSGRAEQLAQALPHGVERKLGVARALATEPRFVLLDEPAAGLTETEVPELASVVESVRAHNGAGVLLIDHNVPLIMQVCSRVQVLDQGRVIALGTPDEILRNADVASAYLGSEAGKGTGEVGRA